jgi:hypothetical protein
VRVGEGGVRVSLDSTVANVATVGEGCSHLEPRRVLRDVEAKLVDARATELFVGGAQCKVGETLFVVSQSHVVDAVESPFVF